MFGDLEETETADEEASDGEPSDNELDDAASDDSENEQNIIDNMDDTFTEDDNDDLQILLANKKSGSLNELAKVQPLQVDMDLDENEPTS
jgi:hypothetical protein